MALDIIIKEMYNERENLIKKYNNDRSKPAWLVKNELAKETIEINRIIQNLRNLYGEAYRNTLPNIKNQSERDKHERKFNMILQSIESIILSIRKLEEDLGYYSPFIDQSAMKTKMDQLLKGIDNIILLCIEIKKNAESLKKDLKQSEREFDYIITGTRNLGNFFKKRAFA
jgi:hypothetical protein